MRLGIAMLAALLAVLGACDRPVRLAPAPTLYRVGMDYPAEDVPATQRSVDATILYVTDRSPVLRDGLVAGYGRERSESMAFGTARVRFAGFGTWGQLVARSESDTRARQQLETLGYDELVRFPETPLEFEVVGNRPRPTAAAAAAYRAQIAAFQDAVAAQLRSAPRKEAFVFVHGVNNQMEDGLTTTASLWHYAGRIGVPICYSWPAGNRGVTAYLKDREAGEFSVFHLKETLRALAEVPGLQAITVVAHSRGTDVATSAIRELALFDLGGGRDPLQTLKIRTLVMAAPDIDFGVVEQRLAAEGMASAVGQVNIYLNPRDGALGLAQAVATGMRAGRISPEDLSEAQWRRLETVTNVHMINVEGAPGRLGHVYFRDNPAVLSDVILTMRTGAVPGSAERPLEQVRGNFWRLHSNYPGPRIVRIVPDNSDR